MTQVDPHLLEVPDGEAPEGKHWRYLHGDDRWVLELDERPTDYSSPHPAIYHGWTAQVTRAYEDGHLQITTYGGTNMRVWRSEVAFV